MSKRRDDAQGSSGSKKPRYHRVSDSDNGDNSEDESLGDQFLDQSAFLRSFRGYASDEGDEEWDEVEDQGNFRPCPRKIVMGQRGVTQ